MNKHILVKYLFKNLQLKSNILIFKIYNNFNLKKLKI